MLLMPLGTQTHIETQIPTSQFQEIRHVQALQLVYTWFLKYKTIRIKQLCACNQTTELHKKHIKF